MKLLVTGAAGFIGFHTARLLLERGDEVVGLDNLNAYYDPALKQARLAILKDYPRFRFAKADVADRDAMETLFRAEKFQRVVHLAAQAGVRYSIENPHIYVHSNITGFLQVIEGCRRAQVEHLVYASTSSVYGANTHMPFSERQGVDHPLTLYAATKRSNELMAHSYSSLYRLPTTGLRFFTVYGPWGRPDMALFLFTKNILAGLPIDVFNDGYHQRDFTYVDDIVEGTLRVLDAGTGTPPGAAPYAIYNIGNHAPVALLDYIGALERALGKKAKLELKPMQPGDVQATYADTRALQQAVGFAPSTPLEVGLGRFAAWFKGYYVEK